MRLVYTATQEPVNVGDKIMLDGVENTVEYFDKPHKPASSGKVTIVDNLSRSGTYFVGVIGAEWIEREDRA